MQKYSCNFCAAQYIGFIRGLAPTAGARRKGRIMIKSLEDLQNFGKANVEASLRSLDVYAKNAQTIAQEVAGYSKKSFDEGSQTVEKLFSAKSLDSAIEIQNAYVKSAYDSFVSQATKLGGLYADFARETYKPFEAQFAAATK